MATREVDDGMRRIVLQGGLRSGLALGALMFVLLLVVTLPAFPVVLEMPFVVVAVAVPVAVYELTGGHIMRATGRLVTGTLARALAGALSGALSGLSLLSANLLFLDTVSRQPDKILAFHASGLPTMQAYLIRNGVLNTGGGLALGTLVGALVGTGSALVWTRWLARQRPGGGPCATVVRTSGRTEEPTRW